MTPAEEESAVRTFFALDAIASPADLAPSLLPWVLLGVLVVVAVTVALIRWDKKKAERRESQGLERRPRADKEEKP